MRKVAEKEAFLPENRPVLKLRKTLLLTFLNILRKHRSDTFFTFCQNPGKTVGKPSVLNFILRVIPRCDDPDFPAVLDILDGNVRKRPVLSGVSQKVLKVINVFLRSLEGS